MNSHEMYLRSTRPDESLFDKDTDTEDAMAELEKGNYGDRRRQAAPARRSASVRSKALTR